MTGRWFVNERLAEISAKLATLAKKLEK